MARFFTKEIAFHTEDGKLTVSFLRAKNVPGFAYVVRILRGGTREVIAKDWLEEGQAPTGKNAGAFLLKHKAKIEAAIGQEGK
jgi:hypothetical protein